MTYSYDLARGGYIPAGSTTPQTGVSSNPYLINFDGTDTDKENQLYINIANYTCDANDLTMVCDKAGLFTITQQSNGYSFVVKLNPSITRTDSRLNDNAKLTVTDPATDTTKEIYVKVIIPPLGSKTAPDAVGDIVFSDGTAEAYTATLTDLQKAEAVAIIFDASTKKGVGLNVGTNLQWAGGDWSSNDPNRGYNMMFSTSDDDGSGNWAVIQARDPAGSADSATWYPAFNWVNNYNAPGYTSGWYIPAKNELLTLYTNRTTVEAAFSALGMTSPFTGEDVVSSSQSSSDTKFVVCRTWDSAGSGARKTSNFCVPAVRVFN